MSTQIDTVDIRKATGQISGLLSAVGIEQAWSAVQNASEDQLSSGQREAVSREIAMLQLGKATEMIKTGGLTPEVVQLLQMLLNLIGGDPGLATPDAPGAPAGPAPGPAEEETAQAHAPPPAPAQKDLPPPLASNAPAHHDDPADLPDKNEGQYGQTAEGDPSFTETGKDIEETTQKDLPAAQKDPLPSSAQSDPQPQATRTDTVRGGSGGGGKEGGDSDPLPGAQSDPKPATPQKDPLPSVATQKAGNPVGVTNDPSKDPRTGLPKGGGWWNKSDIGKTDNPLLERKKYRKTTR